MNDVSDVGAQPTAVTDGAAKVSPVVDPLLESTPVAIAWYGRLSSREWCIVTAEGETIIQAFRGADVVRTALILAMLPVVLAGAGALTWVVMINMTLAVIVGSIIALCLLIVVITSPLVMVRRRKPIVVQSVLDARVLLTITQPSRMAFGHVEYEVQTQDGVLLGRIKFMTSRRVFTTLWHLHLDDEPTIVLREPSPWTVVREGIRQVVRDSTVLNNIINRCIRAAIRSSPKSTLRFLVRRGEHVLAKCFTDETGHWTWLMHDDASTPRERATILAATLLAVTRENA